MQQLVGARAAQDGGEGGQLERGEREGEGGDEKAQLALRALGVSGLVACAVELPP